MARLRQHRGGGAFPVKWKFLAAVKGSRENEQDILSFFKDELIDDGRDQQENLRATQRVVNYIVWLRDFYYVTVDEDVTDVPAMPFASWRPSLQNQKPIRRSPDLLTGLAAWGCLPERVLTQDDYWTDAELIERARATLGGCIDLDPASAWHPNSHVVKAKRFYSVTENGLVNPWFGRIWLNPPFSEWKSWADKVVSELDTNAAISALLVLSNTRTITAKYFDPVLKRAQSMCVLSGRWSFWGTDKDGSPSNGSVILLMRGDPQAFSAHFKDIGTIFTGISQ